MRALLPLVFLHFTTAITAGALRFQVGAKSYATEHAVAMIEKKGAKSRIMIAVKDIEQRFLFLLTADVPAGDELKALRLTTADSQLALTLRTPEGLFAVLPETQLAKANNELYTERVEIATEEYEDDPAEPPNHDERKLQRERKKRRKVRSEYRKVAPRWQKLTREERIRSGEGIIANRAFQDTYFTLTLTPVIQAGKVTAYQGSFSGTARFSQSVSGAEIRRISEGMLNVGVQYAP
jgi:hypothetical protein